MAQMRLSTTNIVRAFTPPIPIPQISPTQINPEEDYSFLEKFESVSFDTIEGMLEEKMTAIRNQYLAELNSKEFEKSNFTNFLSAHYYYLEKLKEYYSKAKIVEHDSGLPPALDIGKKGIDFLDDTWSAVKGGLVSDKIGDLVGPIIVGAAGGIIHLFEGYEAVKMGYHAYKNEKTLARKAKVLSGIAVFAMAGVGTGLSISYLAATAGAAVSGAALMPFLIPAFLTGIYFVSQWRRVKIYAETKKALDIAKENHTKIQHQQEFKNAEAKLKSNQKLDSKDIDILAKNQAAKWLCHEAEEKCREAQRATRFGYVEVAAATSVMLGTILSMAAVVGAATVATCGILPTVLLVIGVAVGMLSKIVEKIDSKYDMVITRNFDRAKKWLGEKLFGKKPVPVPTPKPIPAPSPTPRAAPTVPQQFPVAAAITSATPPDYSAAKAPSLSLFHQAIVTNKPSTPVPATSPVLR